jgi:ABC-type iron transport system FetAB ATPase subunit
MLEIEALRTHIVDVTSLTVQAGECVALTGPSGAGKSMLLRAVVDVDPNEGTVRLDGVERATLAAPAWRRAVDAAADLVGTLGLAEDALSWPVSRLSSGERQRLALARALVLRPKALLLDEPTASLDADATRRVEALLGQELDRGVAILLVTHDPAQADRLATRIQGFDKGRLVRPDAAP